LNRRAVCITEVYAAEVCMILVVCRLRATVLVDRRYDLWNCGVVWGIGVLIQ